MLADNLVHFSRVLRRAGIAVGPDRVLSAIAALEAVGLEDQVGVDDIEVARITGAEPS